MLNLINYSRSIFQKIVYPIYDFFCRDKLDAPQQVIFLLSHMRAGSTLCVNLLCTNPEIIGIGETGIRYHSDKDFRILRGKVYSRRLKLFVGEEYILDNLNHNINIGDYNIFSRKEVRCIFLVRDSDSTLSSLLNKDFLRLVAPKGMNEMKWASGYYRNRLTVLVNYAKIINKYQRNSLYITHEQLTGNTRTTLNSLKNFLGTQHSFAGEYVPISSRGVFGTGFVGDTSKNIASGKVIKKSSPRVQLPSEISRECSETYQSVNAALLKYCSGINDYT